MGLIEGWKTSAFRLWTVQLLSVDVGLQLADIFIPAFSDALPRGVFLGLTVATLIARFVRQSPRSDAQ